MKKLSQQVISPHLSLTFLNLEKADDENLLVTMVQADCEEDSTLETS